MENSDNGLNRQTIRNIASSYFSSKLQKQEMSVSALLDADKLKEMCLNSLNAQLKGDMDFIKLVIFLYALKLKEEFLQRAFEKAKEKGTYFKYTVGVYWRKDPLSFTQNYRISPETSGSVDTIYWYVKKGHKNSNRFSFEKIPLNTQGIKYTSRSFYGSEAWERELIMEYEEQFALIRSILSDIKEIKQKANLMHGRISKLNLKNDIEYQNTLATEDEEELL